MKKVKVIFIVLVVMFCGQLVFSQYIPRKGEIQGAIQQYADTNTIAITPGYGEANGNYWEITEAFLYNVTSLDLLGSFHYLYIDDDASVYPTPTIIDSTTAPSWSSTLYGWYNGNDRCIGVLASPVGNDILSAFKAEDFGNRVEYLFMNGSNKLLLSGANPTGNWETLEATAYTPVNVKKVRIQAYEQDIDSNFSLLVSSFEGKSTGELRANGYKGLNYATDYISLGDSHNLAWKGDNDDDNMTTIVICGYIYSR